VKTPASLMLVAPRGGIGQHVAEREHATPARKRGVSVHTAIA
jgi:hypothetical protein